MGHVTSLDLAVLSSWRLELAELAMQGDSSELAGMKTWLAVGFRYMAEGRAVFQAIAAMQFKKTTGELTHVVNKGFPKGTLVGDRERLQESLGLLRNCYDNSDREGSEIIERGVKLADVYHNIRSTIFSSTAPIANAGPLLRGDFEGWYYAISRERFAGILPLHGITEGGLGAPPGVLLEKPTIQSPPPESNPASALGNPPTDESAPTKSVGKSKRTPPK